MTTHSGPTAAEITKLRDTHSRHHSGMCDACFKRAPCPTIRALDALDQARAVVGEAREYLVREDAWRVGADDADGATRENLSRRVIFARHELRAALATEPDAARSPQAQKGVGR